MRLMKDIKRISLTFALLALAACGARDAAQQPVQVRLETAASVSGAASSYYSGTIEARNSIPLSFLTAGTISDIMVREGQTVKKGDLLGTLDCQNNESALHMAEAKAKQAQDAFRRFEPMYKNGNLPEIKMVEIETARTEAEQALKLAQKSVSDCRLTASTDGIISRRNAEPGSAAIPGNPVLRLESLDQVYASISVPEAEISSIKPGSWASVEIAAMNGPEAAGGEGRGYRDSPSGDNLRLRGAVADTGVSADPLSRTYSVRVLLNNPGRKILPGMLCNVYLQRPGKKKDMALIPATAVNIDETDRRFVYVVSPGGNTASKRFVEMAGFAKGGVVVSAGINPGETVVSEGAQKLSDGAAIKAD